MPREEGGDLMIILVSPCSSFCFSDEGQEKENYVEINYGWRKVINSSHFLVCLPMAPFISHLPFLKSSRVVKSYTLIIPLDEYLDYT